MALSSIRRDRRPLIPARLQITSMMDMFTIILIFLLFSFSNDPDAVTLDKDIELPKSTAETNFKKHLQVIVTQTSVKIGEETVARLDGDDIVGIDPNNLQKSKFYNRLRSFGKVDALTPEADRDPILLLCDRRLSFKVINNVIKTAGMAGYPNFQFAVLQE